MIYMSIELGLALRPVINKTLDVRQSGSTSNRDSITPARGLLRYEHDSPTKWVYYDGTAWQPFEEALFASSTSTDYVQHAIGDITAGTMVADLQQRSITQILTQLLRIGPAPEIILSASGISLAYANGNQEFQVGSDASVTLTLILNRGSVSGGDLHFTPAVGPIAGTPTWGNIDLSIAETATSITMTSDAPFTHSFTTLQDVRLPTMGSIQVQAGPTYLNNYGNEYRTEPMSYTSIGNAPLLRGYLPIYRDEEQTAQYVYATTTYVEITNHGPYEVVDVPFPVSQVRQYETFGSGGDPWRVLSSDDYLVTPVMLPFGDMEITYYSVELTFMRAARNIRIDREF